METHRNKYPYEEINNFVQLRRKILKSVCKLNNLLEFFYLLRELYKLNQLLVNFLNSRIFLDISINSF